MTGRVLDDLPSRPSLVESLAVACTVVGIGAWLATVALRAVDVRDERARKVRLAQEGESVELDESERFAARGQLVEVNLAALGAFDPATAGDGDVSRIAAVVEQLVATDVAEGAAIREALAAFARRLDAHEAEEGFLDPALETARELARGATAEEQR